MALGAFLLDNTSYCRYTVFAVSCDLKRVEMAKNGQRRLGMLDPACPVGRTQQSTCP